MARLFVAIETPPGMAAQWLRTLPAVRGIRPVPAEQVHLTLHFLGERDEPMATRIETALSAVQAPSFMLTVDGVGRFRGGQGCVLWVGLSAAPLAEATMPATPNAPGLAAADPLQALHADIGNALQTIGIAPERRRFHPHLTLARCRPGVPEAVLREWLSTHRVLPAHAWRAARFVLYESQLGPHGALHTCRRAYPLAGAGSVTPGC